jgi:muconolactone delta-isomerase
MEFLVEFDVHFPAGASESEVDRREAAEASAAAKLVEEGNLVRLWKRPAAADESKALGIYRADSETQLGDLLDALPLRDWMHVTVTPLEPHPNDPAAQQLVSGRRREDATVNREDASVSPHLPDPRLTLIYRLEATLAPPLDLGDTAQGHRRVVPLTGGTFRGPEISGKLLPGASADWQIILADGTALGDIRYILQTEGGDLLYVRSQSIRHGSPEVLARLGRGENVDPSEYTFRTATEIETAAPDLEWLNKGVFISVAGRQAAGVIYETYLVA